MADYFTGEQELEIGDAVRVYEKIIADLQADNASGMDHSAAIAHFQSILAANQSALVDEVPTPLRCPACTKPERLECEYGHEIDPATGFSVGIEYLPLGAH